MVAEAEEEGSATVTGDEGACQQPRALGHGRAGLREAKEKTLKKGLDSGGKLEKKTFLFRVNYSGAVLYIYSLDSILYIWVARMS